MRNAILFSLGICMAFITFGQSHNPEFLDGSIMIKYKNAAEHNPVGAIQKDKNNFSLEADLNDHPEIAEIFDGLEVSLFERPSFFTFKEELMKIYRIQFKAYEKIDSLVEELNKLEALEYATKQAIYQTSFIPNDTYHSGNDKWYHTLVGSENAWNFSLGRGGVKLAIIDNAVFCNHNDLSVFRQYDVADNDGDATPPQTHNQSQGWSHGTHCAGLATANINNNTGIASLGGNVELIGVKATPSSANSSSIWYSYSAVQWACENGAHVVSMSYGGSNSDASMQTLINAYPEVVFLAAAGNNGNTQVQYPAGYNNVIGVGSVDANDSRSSFSNYNGGTTFVDIASPGGFSFGGLLSTVYTSSGNAYARQGGTSMATPFAAGLVGLMLSINPSLSPTQILNCLSTTGVNINQNIGKRIDANAAVQCVLATVNGDPIPNFFATPTNIIEGDSVQFYDNSADGGNTITNWEWTFNGGIPGFYIGQNPPMITYAAAGNYTVELKVTNSQDSAIMTRTSYINVSLQPYGEWIPQNSGFSASSRGINYISIADANTVWATAYDGSGGGANIQEFTKTINGGQTWTPGTINIGNSGLGISMVHAIDANTAWVAAYPTAGGQTGGIWKTTNGGNSWSRQNSASYNNAASFTNVVYFWDANVGFCQGDPINGEFELYTTNNGGTTWTAVPGANIPNPSNNNEFGYTRQIEVVGDNVWFTTSLGRIYHSTNRGLNWSVYQSPVADFGGAITTGTNANLSFADASNGLIIDNNGVVYSSSNGGSTWATIATTGPIYTSGLCYVEGTNIAFSTGAGAGNSGSSFSLDGGINWNLIDTDQHLYVEFINQSIGWSGWFNADANNDGIWKWNDLSSPISTNFSGVPFNVCVNDTVQFTDQSTGGTIISWNWSFPGGTPSSSTASNPFVTYNQAGTYEVSLTVSDGTFQSTFVDSAHITVVNPTSTPSLINGDNTPCAFAIETYSVVNTPDVFYNWQLSSGWFGTSSSNSITVNLNDTSGLLSVTADNACGSSAASQLNIIITDTLVNADFSYSINGYTVNFTNISTNNFSQTWDFGDGNSSTAAQPSHVYASGGTYTVLLTVNNGCGYVDTLSQQITIVITSMENTLVEAIQLYPNPGKEMIYLDNIPSTYIGNAYRILDVLGRTVGQGIINEPTQSIDILSFAKGCYFIELPERNKQLRFVKD